MATKFRNDTYKIGGFDYFFKKDGSMLANDIDGNYKYYYADKDGHLQFGWVTHNNETYYISHHGELKTEHIYKISMKRPIFGS